MTFYDLLAFIIEKLTRFIYYFFELSLLFLYFMIIYLKLFIILIKQAISTTPIKAVMIFSKILSS